MGQASPWYRHSDRGLCFRAAQKDVRRCLVLGRLNPQDRKNIGVDAQQIHIQLGGLLRDARYWTEHVSFSPDEMAIRLHHGLVVIHPFPNGNGRHARLAADLLIAQVGGQPFSWGGGTLRDIGTLRAEYIAALRAADQHDFASLLTFARS